MSNNNHINKILSSISNIPFHIDDFLIYMALPMISEYEEFSLIAGKGCGERIVVQVGLMQLCCLKK